MVAILQKITGTINMSNYPPLKSDDNSMPICDIKANLLNRFFCAQTLVKNEKIELPKEENTSDICTLSEIIITTHDVQDILETLDTSKATGPDSINSTLLKQASLAIAEPLCKFFLSSFITD